jgi:hypothetical protein
MFVESVLQISAISSADGTVDPSGGPMWSKFFNSIGAVGDVAAEDGDTESIVSASDVLHTPSRQNFAPTVDTPGSELAPGDSASVIHDDESAIRPAQSSVAGTGIVDDGTYLFKFLAPGGTTHRFQARYSGDEVFDLVQEIVGGKLASDPFFSASPSSLSEVTKDPTDFKLSYLDDDGDLVQISNDRDVEDAVRTAKKQGKDRVVLQLRGGRGWEQAMNPASKEAAQAKTLAAIVEDETETAEAIKDKKLTKGQATIVDDLAFGVLPKEYLLPGAIALLSVTILAVFAFSRPARR